MASIELNAEQKPASEYTKALQYEVAEKLDIDRENADNSECEYAARHCILSLEEGYSIKTAGGQEAWSLDGYQFLKRDKISDTVNPSLWLNGKASIEAGVFEVLPGKIYQVRRSRYCKHHICQK